MSKLWGAVQSFGRPVCVVSYSADFLFGHADYLHFYRRFAGEAGYAYCGAGGRAGFAQFFAEVFACEVGYFRVGREAFARVDVDGH